MNSFRNRRAIILLVEDEVLVRWATATVLREAGYQVLDVERADEALSILERRSDIAVVFTDINMPGRLDGRALAFEVKRRWPAIGLLVTSGDRREPANRGCLMEAGSSPSPIRTWILSPASTALITPPRRRRQAAHRPGGSRSARWIWLVGRNLDGYRDNELGAARAVDRQARIHLLQDGGQDPHAHACSRFRASTSPGKADALIPDGQGEGL